MTLRMYIMKTLVLQRHVNTMSSCTKTLILERSVATLLKYIIHMEIVIIRMRKLRSLFWS